MTTLYPQYGIFYVPDPTILLPKLNEVNTNIGEFETLIVNNIEISGTISSTQQLFFTINPTQTNNNGFQTLLTIPLPLATTYIISAKIVASGTGISGAFTINAWVDNTILTNAVIRQIFDSTFLASGQSINMQFITDGINVYLQQNSLGHTVTWNGYVEQIGTRQ
jgi:hypothetical protein